MAEEKKTECKACMSMQDGKKCDDCQKLMKSGTASEDVGGDSDGGGGEGGGDDSTEMRTCRGDVVELAANSTEQREVWIQVAKQGKFRGHASGPFEMTAQTFAEIIRNFNAQQNRAIPIDFEHASEQPPTHGSIPLMGAPAQGWITELSMREDGNLWGKVTWGKLARQYIKDGQYKYLSPAIFFGAKDRVTGKPIGARLSSVGLTNNPFLDGMQPVAASARNTAVATPGIVSAIGVSLGLVEAQYGDPSFVHTALRWAEGSKEKRAMSAASLRDGLRLPLTASDDEVFITARVALGETLPPSVAPAAINPNPPATATNQEAHMGENEKKDQETQLSNLTLKLSAAEASLVTMKSEYESKIVALTNENTDLKAKLNEHAEKEVEGLVTAAIQCWGEKKGLSEAMRPHLMRLAKNDREGFNALYPAVPANQRHLSSTIASGAHAVPGPQIAPGGGEGGAQVIKLKDVMDEAQIPTIDALVTKLMSANPQLSREEAYSKAHAERTTLINTAASKRLAGNFGG